MHHDIVHSKGAKGKLVLKVAEDAAMMQEPGYGGYGVKKVADYH